MGKEQLEAKREEVRLLISKYFSGYAERCIEVNGQEIKIFQMHVLGLITDLSSLGVCIEDRENKIAVSGLDEGEAEFYHKTYPLEVIKDEKKS